MHPTTQPRELGASVGESLLSHNLMMSGGAVPEIPLGELHAMSGPDSGVAMPSGCLSSAERSDSSQCASVIERTLVVANGLVGAALSTDGLSSDVSGQVLGALDNVAWVRTTVTNIKTMASTLQKSIREHH